MPDSILTPEQRKALQKAADTCARCKPFLAKMREMQANVDDEAARVQHLEESLLTALGYERESGGGIIG